MGQAFLIPALLATTAVSTGLSVYSGVQQASAMSAQAKQAEKMAAYNAEVQRLNALEANNQKQFQASVEEYNTQLLAQRRDREARLKQEKTARDKASLQADASRRGAFDYSFDDILRNQALLAEREELDMLFDYNQQIAAGGRQADIRRYEGQRAIETGRTASAMTLSEGAYTAYSLRSKAKASTFGALGAGISGLGRMSEIGYMDSQSANPVLFG